MSTRLTPVRLSNKERLLVKKYIQDHPFAKFSEVSAEMRKKKIRITKDALYKIRKTPLSVLAAKANKNPRDIRFVDSLGDVDFFIAVLFGAELERMIRSFLVLNVN